MEEVDVQKMKRAKAASLIYSSSSDSLWHYQVPHQGQFYSTSLGIYLPVDCDLIISACVEATASLSLALDCTDCSHQSHFLPLRIMAFPGS